MIRLKSRACLAAASLALASLSPAAHSAWNTNLVANPGAEAAGGGGGTFDGSYLAGSLPGWTVSGELTAVSYNLPPADGYPLPGDPGPADRGVNFFGGGYGSPSTGSQTIDLGFAQDGINGNGAYFQLSGWLGGYADQDDHAVLLVNFRDAANQVVGSGSLGPVLAADRGEATALLYRELSGWVPVGATSAVVDLTMNRAGGAANDGYADNLALSLIPANVQLTAPATATVGSSFSVDVVVLSPFSGSYAGDELLAFGFDLGFDPGLLSLTGVSVAAPWDDDSGFFNDVEVAGSSFESIADAGQDSLSLATLTFQVIGAGNALIDIHSSAATNLNQGLTYLNGSSADLYGRANVAAVPLPGAAVLLGSALGLFGWRVRRGV